MFDEPEVKHRILDEALKTLSELGVMQECPRCGHDEYLADIAAYLMADMGAADHLLPPRMPVINLTCQKCGFISTHNLKALKVIPLKRSTDAPTATDWTGVVGGSSSGAKGEKE